MYVWDASTEEIGLCMLDYCHKKANEGARVIAAFSDLYGGEQNRNHKLFMFWMHICMTTAIAAVDHKFLISGHSYLLNDADFGVIEQATKKSALGLCLISGFVQRSCKRSKSVYSSTNEP